MKTHAVVKLQKNSKGLCWSTLNASTREWETTLIKECEGDRTLNEVSIRDTSLMSQEKAKELNKSLSGEGIIFALMVSTWLFKEWIALLNKQLLEFQEFFVLRTSSGRLLAFGGDSVEEVPVASSDRFFFPTGRESRFSSKEEAEAALEEAREAGFLAQTIPLQAEWDKEEWAQQVSALRSKEPVWFLRTDQGRSVRICFGLDGGLESVEEVTMAWYRDQRRFFLRGEAFRSRDRDAVERLCQEAEKAGVYCEVVELKREGFDCQEWRSEVQAFRERLEREVMVEDEEFGTPVLSS